MAAILLAEDEPSVAAFVSRALTNGGHEVVAVPDGMAALAALAARPFDLLLTDIVMPGLDGIALALKAGKDHPAMKILLMTGYAAERQRAHNLEALVHRVIDKPFTLEQIRAAVAAELAAPEPPHPAPPNLAALAKASQPSPPRGRRGKGEGG
jgi:two-component system, cell cycle response regulator CpdR